MTLYTHVVHMRVHTDHGLRGGDDGMREGRWHALQHGVGALSAHTGAVDLKLCAWACDWLCVGLVCMISAEEFSS